MWRAVLMVGLVLSLLLILVAAILGPEDFSASANDVNVSPHTPVMDRAAWCAMMEQKPNKNWQGDDFQRFANDCL